MPTSCLQTTFYYPNGNPNNCEIIKSICPVLPRNITQLETRNEDKYFYYYQSIVCLKKNRDVYYWYIKPTLQYALTTSLKNEFFKFNSDGTVISKHITNQGKTISLEWEKSIEVPYVEGHRFNGQLDLSTFTYYKHVSCRYCGGDCSGSDYEDWELCCRDCMKEFNEKN
jgi:hypothetical protein